SDLVQYSMAIKFKLPPQTDTTTTNQVKYHDTTKIYTAVEHEPEFPGGFDNFNTYLIQNTKYPSVAVKNQIQGIVYISVIIEKDGNFSDVKIIRGVWEE